MKRLIESIQVFGQIFSVVMGSNFTRPYDSTLQQYRYLRPEV